jgi:hypothetical protein
MLAKKEAKIFRILLSCSIELLSSDYISKALSPSRRREAPCEGTNPPRLFTPGETKALAESKVHQISRAWVTVRVSVVVILTDLII